MYEEFKILIVDEETQICNDFEQLFANENFTITKADSGKRALEIISSETFDVILLDIILPDMSGYELINHLRSQLPDAKIIFMTGYPSFFSEMHAFKKGVFDFIKKPFEIKEIKNKIHEAIRRKQPEVAIDSAGSWSENFQDPYYFLVQQSPDIIFILDPQGRFAFINNTVEKLTGVKPESLIGKPYTEIFIEEDVEKAKWLLRERRTGERTSIGAQIRLKISDGTSTRFRYYDYEYDVKEIYVELKTTGLYDRPVADPNKIFLGTHGVARDINERRYLESNINHHQRIQAIGTLAAGIAHDFNNIMMGIQGRVSLMLLGKESSHPDWFNLKEIENYIESAAHLTKQLIGYARKGKFEVVSTNINSLIQKSSDMFGRMHREIIIKKKFQPDLWPVDVDRGQIEQVLINLFINASQAMPDGGTLFLETQNIVLDSSYKKPFVIEPGRYIKISVTDTGVGMAKATQERIFEPFFTTKNRSRSTGLGMASVYGIIKNHGGIIKVYSEKGHGTTFNIYLPASNKIPVVEKETEQMTISGSETILLIDDDQISIDVGKDILEALGYTVFIAMSGIEGVEIYRKNRNVIHLVILDMIMPEMSGSAVYDQLKKINPKVKVLFASGYSEGKALDVLENSYDRFIQKPFRINKLSQIIRSILSEEEML